MSDVHRRARCEVCGGRAYEKRMAATGRLTGTWLHLHRDDWADNPHDVVPTDIEEWSPRKERVQVRCAGCDRELDDGGFRVLGRDEVLIVCRPSCLVQWWWRKRFSRRRAA